MESIAAAIAAAVVALAAATVAWIVRGRLAQSERAAQEASHRERVAGLEARLAEGGAAAEAIKAASDRLRDAVAKAVREGGDALVGLADQNFRKSMAEAGGELSEKQREFESLVKPLADVYAKLEPRIEQLDAEIHRVVAETAKLSGALSDQRSVGRWGELQLRRVVELAGMSRHCDFVEQAVCGNGRARPDMVVRLPNGRAVVVDAKASLEAFVEAGAAKDGEAAKIALARHAKNLKRQIDQLAKKDYGAGVAGAVDFAVMFVPGDQFLSAALEVEPDLVAHGMGKRVAVATPASLVALLWAVAHGWQQVEIARNAKEIETVGRQLHEGLLRHVGECRSVGKALETAVKAHNESVAAFDGGVLPKGRRFAELLVGGANESELRAEPVDEPVRLPKSAGPEAVAPRAASAGGPA